MPPSKHREEVNLTYRLLYSTSSTDSMAPAHIDEDSSSLLSPLGNTFTDSQGNDI